MDGTSVSGAQARRASGKRRKKSLPGLKVKERDGYWHVQGTLRVKGQSIRVRRSTELPARDDLWDAADRKRREIEDEICNQVAYGAPPAIALAVAAREYLGLDRDGNPLSGSRAETLGGTDIRNLKDVVAHFGLVPLADISTDQWRAFLDRRHANCIPDTRQRYASSLRVFLKWCAHEDRGYLKVLPDLSPKEETARGKRARRHPTRRRVAELRPDLLAFLFSFAAIHIRAQLYVEWSTGARVSSVLFGCRLSDLVLTETRQQITFRDTKNGDDVIAALHPACVPVLQEYLAWRGNLHLRNGPLFLNDHKKPYSEVAFRKGRSGSNKRGVGNMKRRAILALLRQSVRARRAGDGRTADALKADAKLIRQVTQHWLRHWFATYSMADNTPDRLIMEQGGWRDHRSLARYKQDVPDMRRRAVEGLPIQPPSVTSVDTSRKPGGYIVDGK